MTNNKSTEEKKVRYKFKSYYKYSFYLELEDGTLIYSPGDSGEIYRLDIRNEGDAIKEVDDDGSIYYLVDGVKFEKLS